MVGVGGECCAMEVRREDKGKGRTVRKRKKSQSTEEDLVSTKEPNTAKIQLLLHLYLCVRYIVVCVIQSSQLNYLSSSVG